MCKIASLFQCSDANTITNTIGIFVHNYSCSTVKWHPANLKNIFYLTSTMLCLSYAEKDSWISVNTSIIDINTMRRRHHWSYEACVDMYHCSYWNHCSGILWVNIFSCQGMLCMFYVYGILLSSYFSLVILLRNASFMCVLCAAYSVFLYEKKSLYSVNPYLFQSQSYGCNRE